MRKPDPKNADKQRQKIIKGALKCFARRGVHGTSTDDICHAADVSAGTLYYYFKSRDGLMHDLIVHVHAARDNLLNNLTDTPNLIDALIDAQLASAETIKTQGVTMEVYLELLAYSTRNAAVQHAFQEAAAHAISILTDVVSAHQRAGKLTTAIDADALAELISVAVTGMSIVEITLGKNSHERFRETLSKLTEQATCTKPGSTQ